MYRVYAVYVVRHYCMHYGVNAMILQSAARLSPNDLFVLSCRRRCYVDDDVGITQAVRCLAGWLSVAAIGRDVTLAETDASCHIHMYVAYFLCR